MNILLTGASRGIGAATRTATENVARDIDGVEQGFGRFSHQIAEFKITTGDFVSKFAA
jgi:methyl-accepting chemotaxis protein